MAYKAFKFKIKYIFLLLTFLKVINKCALKNSSLTWPRKSQSLEGFFFLNYDEALRYQVKCPSV